MSHKVILWGTGFVGKMVIRELLDHPSYDHVKAVRAKVDGGDITDFLRLGHNVPTVLYVSCYVFGCVVLHL